MHPPLISVDHIRDLRPQNLALLLKRLNSLNEQLIAIPLPSALNREDKVIPSSPQLNLALELGMA